MADNELAGNPFRELARRFLITILLGIVVYRFGTVVPVPGVSVTALASYIKGGQGGAVGVLNWADMFNGGAISNGSVFGLGIMPYISASIIIQLLAFSYPALKQLQREGEGGRRKLNQYTRYITVLICLVQSGMAAFAFGKIEGGSIVPNWSIWFVIQSMLVITCGSMVLLWIGEQISRFGVGNGVSVLIMVGILARFPQGMKQVVFQGGDQTVNIPSLLWLLLTFLGIIAFMVTTTMARRRLNLEQQRRIQGNRVYGGAQTQLPLMLNHAGVIPVIFTSPLMIVLGMVVAWTPVSDILGHEQPLYRYVFAAIIVFFTFFYISITVDLNEWANNFKQGGFFIRGVKPGHNTAEYIRFRLRRITVVGALSLAAVAIVPPIIGDKALGIPSDASYSLLGGIGLLIVVGVSLDVIQKVQGFLLAHQYQGLMSGQQGKFGLGGRPAPGKKRF